MSGPTLAQQLKALHESASGTSAKPSPAGDLETAYTSLDSLDLPAREGNEGREHYLQVGPSRLRAGEGGMGLGQRYEGQVRGRMKIFDDDEEEGDGRSDEDDGEEEEDDDDDDDDDDDEDEDDVEEDEDDEEDEDEDEEAGDDEDDDEADLGTAKPTSAPPPRSSQLDPLASLRTSRLNDLAKGKAIKNQKALFDTLVTLRITLQKALAPLTSNQFALTGVHDASSEVDSKRDELLESLAELNDSLLSMREGLALPGSEPVTGAKRSRDDMEGYWLESARTSFALSDSAHPAMLPILDKWSSKIQAATVQAGTKAGSSKFAQSTKTGSSSVIDLIDADLASGANTTDILQLEDSSYRALLREVIDSRAGSSHSDLSHLRREKKKIREAERGGSKGRKLRYTVHEKAAHFVVATPLARGWEEGQVDELFGSLFAGAGMGGARSTEQAPVGMGGLRVF